LLASDQTLPGITAFADDLLGILLVLAFTAEGELVLRLAIWDLVDTEPFVRCSEKAWKMTLDIFNVVQLGRKRVVDLYRVSGMSLWKHIVTTDVNDNNLPVGFFFVEQCHHTEDLDLLHLASIANQFADLADI
jgi:hypothetical protein